ncbi:MAG TPA: hypothetical protein PK941_10325 [Paludibacter sp.]|nr:hypothetical protein [Paludibacter sp.]
MGAFENEVALWLNAFKRWIYSHERFTWINLALSIVPSPIAGFLAVILASLQIYLCIKGRIPQTENRILLVALVLGLMNFVLSTILVIYLVKKGWSLWNTFNPFLWFFPLKEKLFKGSITYV